MKTDETHTFIQKNQAAIYKHALSQVRTCLWVKYRRRADQITDAREGRDIVQEVLTKVWSEPIELGEELTLDSFNRLVRDLIYNEVSERNRRDKLGKPRPNQGFGELTPDKVFDQLIAENIDNEAQLEFETRVTMFVECVHQLIAMYDSDPTRFERWLVLTEWWQKNRWLKLRPAET